jgi:hypothetical protein
MSNDEVHKLVWMIVELSEDELFEIASDEQIN